MALLSWQVFSSLDSDHSGEVDIDDIISSSSSLAASQTTATQLSRRGAPQQIQPEQILLEAAAPPAAVPLAAAPPAVAPFLAEPSLAAVPEPGDDDSCCAILPVSCRLLERLLELHPARTSS